MKLVNIGVLDAFKRKYADARGWINNWVSDVRVANWKTTHDVRAKYNTSSFLADRVIIFNVKGNTYRLEVKVNFPAQVIMVLWAGTHADYDRRNSLGKVGKLSGSNLDNENEQIVEKNKEEVSKKKSNDKAPRRKK